LRADFISQANRLQLFVRVHVQQSVSMQVSPWRMHAQLLTNQRCRQLFACFDVCACPENTCRSRNGSTFF
jgi:Pyruvate/2-oxoacid:ferredoxin oxidoreductase delta subunit